MEERLQKYMAECGVASRRKCEKMIQDGRVKVNGTIVTELGFKVDYKKDTIELDNKEIKLEDKKVYAILNKPKGYLTAASDYRGRKTVIDLLNFKERVFPVGRLDFNTTGLLIVTNDGEIFNRIMHPRQNVNKCYLATVKGKPQFKHLDALRKGIDIGGYITKEAEVSVVSFDGKNSILKIVIHEGKKRQVRRMCAAVGFPVEELKRISIGNIKLGDLKEGNVRMLNKEEIEYLRSL
ncbi:23S rRNA pseudouridine2605 synthase [Clostridium acetobutylicum]|uniref:Pseudouridine synthase n=1 Tax=Clostridium acetobutylicum (strain ATCC 824 / DSM 792 / JCM 1419 / IAM 19013 / LMG 5710 / NBRC 13948 / NRRL B-527 / VKM B-1787 / 2291 / W) TaxID=272562 RepID=Q97I05_CLOAB|nr:MULTISPECIES: pseudouridine synthase [Clostridium]AAK79815.1 Predicted pseudouridylate synthase [Clostridium acetobutylicum ATCC 824]ADZ20901.1 pseudouridylate synthase [Clostridium acetobutylicum EA 2018]AEI33209.1 pseudouridylate synthase [Clostridium acetobutylicum DSM 1731]AWV79752.1 rRNA pseudouridine synthase [Clostridium acetobutylicum]MBC2394268.1 rRNA pseudouridine synthase [Clostridium acetobutylicum]